MFNREEGCVMKEYKIFTSGVQKKLKTERRKI